MTKELDREDQIADLEKRVEELTRALGKKIINENKIAFSVLAKDEKSTIKSLLKKPKKELVEMILNLQIEVEDLSDNCFYEGLINQLEDQADRLIKERDTYYLALKEAVDIMNIPDGICENLECIYDITCRECLMKRFIDYAKQKYDVETHSKEKKNG